MDDTEKLIDKIRKLKAKAEGTTNEAEAEAFMKKVQELLVQHNLNASDLEVEEEEYGIISDDQYYASIWKEMIWNSIATLYFCKAIRTKRTVMKRRGGGYKNIKVYIIAGSKSNATVAREMIGYVIDTIERLSKEAAKEHDMDRTERERFCSGAALRISDRVKEMVANRDRSIKTTTSSNLPALYSQELAKVDDFVAQALGATEESTKNIKYNRLGYNAGDSIGLNDQISGGCGSSVKLEG